MQNKIINYISRPAIVILFLLSVGISIIGFITDPVMDGVNWTDSAEILGFGLPGFLACFLLLSALYTVGNSVRRHQSKFIRFAALGFAGGFIAQQIFQASSEYGIFTHFTFEGPFTGNIFGITLNIFNYLLALVFALLGLLLDIFLYFRRSKK